MDQLDSLIGGKYIFFKSLSNNANLAARVGSVKAQFTGIGGAGQNTIGPPQSNDYLKFSSFMNSYLNKLQSIAAKWRAIEVRFVQKSIENLSADGKKIIADNDIERGLQELAASVTSGDAHINEKNYHKLIAAINVIKYQDDLEHFKSIIQEQTANIEAVKTNLAKIKELDEDEYKELSHLYEINYGKYINQYTEDITNKFKADFKAIQKTYLTQVAEKINSALYELSKVPGLEQIINDIWTQYPGDTTIDLSDTQYVDNILDQIVRKALADVEQGPKTLVKNLLQEIKIDPSLIFGKKENQSAKAFIRKNNSRKKSFEEAILDNNRILGKILDTASNGEEILQHICGDSKQVKKILKIFRTAKKKVDEAKEAEKNQAWRTHFDSKVRDILKNTEHMKEFEAHLENNTSIKSIINKGFKIIKPEEIVAGLRGKLQFRIKKSALSEVVALYHNEIVDHVFNNLPGSVNMKDDVFAVVKLSSNTIEVNDQAIDNELQPVITEINKVIHNYLSDYIETYASRDDGSTEKKGTTDVARARNIYVQKMTDVYTAIKEIIDQYPDLAAAIEQYGKDTDTFLESISVKDYTLYNDAIGFHAGTLGPKWKPGDTSLKALENIQEMYRQGGISIIDMATLEFAILNCSPYAVMSDVKPALESYLLGGAALMVFDQGLGEAQAYLENMESMVDALMPKDLNLYFLNQGYVPASYIITSIYTNLSAFYNQELNDGYEEFMTRNRVLIINNASENLIPKTGTLQDKFEATAAAAWSQIDIQFIFMAGMLEIFQNLGTVFNVR